MAAEARLPAGRWYHMGFGLGVRVHREARVVWRNGEWKIYLEGDRLDAPSVEIKDTANRRNGERCPVEGCVGHDSIGRATLHVAQAIYERTGHLMTAEQDELAAIADVQAAEDQAAADQAAAFARLEAEIAASPGAPQSVLDALAALKATIVTSDEAAQAEAPTEVTSNGDEAGDITGADQTAGDTTGASGE